MNCQQCQKEIVELLSASANSLTPAVREHQNSCPACRSFYDAQRDLFQSLDAGLKSLVNQPVPPSLLPSIRARMDEQPTIGSAWVTRWGLAATVAVLILLFAIGHRFHRTVSPPSVLENSLTASRNASPPQQAAPAVEKSAEDLPRHRTSYARAMASSTVAPEVIVLAEEREAFARFVAEMPQNPQVALALTRPAPPLPDDTTEIALLKIDNLEVKPLEPSTK
jgi:anti-sigma factor RsiW